MTTDVDAREWWERAAERRAAWWSSRPGLARGVARLSNALVWVSVLALVLTLALWPSVAWGVRVWIGIAWVALCWALLGRTRTLRIGSLFRILSLSVPWSFAIGALSLWLSSGPAGLDGPDETPAAVVIASIVEETLKLAPLALLALCAPGRVRRFAVADWALVGIVSGLSFELVEEALRRIYLMSAKPGIWDMLDFCRMGEEGAARLECWGAPTFGLNPFGTGVSDGVAPYAGHGILTGLVAVSVGLAVRIFRGRLLGASRWPVAIGLPAFAFALALVDHAARNGSKYERFDQVDAGLPQVLSWFHLLSGAGHAREAALIGLLIAGMVLDASLYRLANLADVIPKRSVGVLERAYIRARILATRLPHSRVAWLAASIVDLAFMILRDLRDDAVLLLSPSAGATAKLRAARRVRDVRGLWDQQRAQREEVQRWAHDDPATGGRGSVRLWALGLTIVGFGLVLVVTPLLASSLDAALDPRADFDWLAGVLQAVGEWWNDLPIGWKVAGAIVLGAAIIASGGTLGFALGVGGVAWTAMDRADDLGRFVEDPKGTLDSYLSQNSPGDVAVDVGLLALSFAGEGAIAAVGGKLAKTGLEAAGRTHLAKSLRDHVGELPRAIVSVDPELLGRTYSGGGLPLKSEVPHWLRRVREGTAFHRNEQRRLDGIPGGHSEVHVHRQDKSGLWTTKNPYRVDHYNHLDRQIISIKHTQLANVSEQTAFRYLDELVQKYKPGTPIADVPSTPGELLGKELEGQMSLLVEQQHSPVPPSVLERARSLKITIVDEAGRIYR